MGLQTSWRSSRGGSGAIIVPIWPRESGERQAKNVRVPVSEGHGLAHRCRPGFSAVYASPPCPPRLGAPPLGRPLGVYPPPGRARGSVRVHHLTCARVLAAGLTGWCAAALEGALGRLARACYAAPVIHPAPGS